MNPATLVQLLNGRGAHVEPVACFEDLSFEFAGRRLPYAPHTIWQLLVHINFWIDFELRWIETSQRPEVKDWAVSWPHGDGPRDEAEYQREVARLRSQIDQLVALEEAQASTRARIIDKERAYTVEDAVGLLVAHNSYHVGQAMMLRRMVEAGEKETVG